MDASENDTQEGSNSSEEDENENYDISHDEVVSHATNSIKQPAYTELRTIREASELYRSNSFKLSVSIYLHSSMFDAYLVILILLTLPILTHFYRMYDRKNPVSNI